MPEKLKQMTGEEFVKKILAGERDFSGIELEEGYRLSYYEGFGEMQEYLRGQDLKKNPISISDSKIGSDDKFRCFIADGLYCPFISAMNANLENACLRGANLIGANFEKANLDNARLEGTLFASTGDPTLYELLSMHGVRFIKANLRGANLRGATLVNAKFWCADLENADLSNTDLTWAGFRKANLENADLTGANLTKANFDGAYLCGTHFMYVKNLEESQNLEYASFIETKVTSKEKAIIEKALRKRMFFVVKD